MATPNDPEIHFEQPRSTFGTWLGIVLLFAIFGLFVWAVMAAMPKGSAFKEKKVQERLGKLKTVNEESQKAMSGYGWVDKEKGVVRLPINRAMEVTMNDLAQKKPTAAGPIPPEGVAPGMQATAPAGPAPATTPAGAGQPQPTPHTAITGVKSETEGKAAASANPPDAQPGTQPGPYATPAASPPAPASKAQVGEGHPTATPMQSPPGNSVASPRHDAIAFTCAMSMSNLLSRVKFRQQDAEVIFDRDEPVGQPTDLVMPRRKRRLWGRRKTNHAGTGRPKERSLVEA